MIDIVKVFEITSSHSHNYKSSAISHVWICKKKKMLKQFVVCIENSNFKCFFVVEKWLGTLEVKP